MKIDNYDLNLIKELKESIYEYNTRYYAKVKFPSERKYWLPKIGFEIKNKKKLPGIISNYDDDIQIYDRLIEVLEGDNYPNIDTHDVFFSVVFCLDHKSIIWRVSHNHLEEDIYLIENIEEVKTKTPLINRSFKNTKYKNMDEVVNYISSQIKDTYEKFPPNEIF
tara:strand:- start:294 stop:788 length:495 start_codon:yes stop_codon:yes gene_type:complete